ncbi:methylmalonyl-CoA epimerase [Bartonella sp. HY406]|uniref:methylmalonyl-CoA epimerase n=1 Tax=Bartonella sp. HY406 TaxID=2979331 RepID=UPI0021C813EE|nr:methylmalonyl-CoA epimerase [Bartonella sp. HY406]UXN04904.1 methylmalonyl-CoA epimerase [Bartonella sp. HY406]
MSQFGRLNHVAIAVPNLEQAAKHYQMLSAEVSAIEDLPEHGVSVVFITFENSKIELLYPLGEHSPIAGFLAKNPNGGVHHICFEVDDIVAMRDKLRANNFRILGDGTPKIGAHGKPVLFIHPKDFDGTLIEIEQA